MIYWAALITMLVSSFSAAILSACLGRHIRLEDGASLRRRGKPKTSDNDAYLAPQKVGNKVGFGV